MREIKFREAIYKDGEFVKFHYWGYDDGMIGLPFLESNKSANSKGLYVKANEQYTGIKDCDGKEIHEGDVVGVKYKSKIWGRDVKYDFKGVVCFGHFESTEREGIYDEILGYYIEVGESCISLAEHELNLKIIGNVHENKGE